ncbi:hypothetical protein ACVWXB_000398 [Streptomyces sp. TE12347]
MWARREPDQAALRAVASLVETDRLRADPGKDRPVRGLTRRAMA